MAHKRGNGILFLGSKSIGLRALQTLQEVVPSKVSGVVTIDDTLDNRSVLHQFQSFCKKVEVPLSVITKPRVLGDIIYQYTPQVVLVVGWYWIIPSALLQYVPGGFVGVHASLLPKYRGNSPLVWAILRGDTQTGVSLFYFDEGIDTGDIVDQRVFSIEYEESIADIIVKAEKATVDIIYEYADQLYQGSAPRTKQDNLSASYISRRTPEDGKINWCLSAIEIYNFIRAQTKPYPGAFTYLPDGKRLFIWRASVFLHPYYGIPGLVGQRVEDGIVIVCGEGAIIVHECEIESEPNVSIQKVLKWGTRL